MDELLDELLNVEVTEKSAETSNIKVCINSKGYGINLNSIPKNEVEILKKELTVKPLRIPGYDFGPEEKYPVYRINSTKLYVPKYYGLKRFPNVAVKKYDERLGEDISLKFDGSLLPHQVDFVNKILKHIDVHDSCIGSSPTGSGKTVMLLWILHILRKKALILVHKEFLMDQWIERISKYLPDARVGKIRQSTVDIVDKDIVVGMLQSISMKEYDTDIFDSFGLTVIDECFVYDQLIITDKGPVQIGKLYHMWKEGKDINVLSYNETKNCTEYRKVTYAWEKTNEDILEINYGRSTIKCTEKHKILTPNGYIEAKDLKLNDLIKCSYKEGQQNSIAQNLNEDLYQILLGSFLGDGHIRITSNNRYRLSIIHCEKQKEYCEWKAYMFNCKVRKIENNGYAKGIAYTFNTKIFDTNKIFPEKKTTCPQWILDDLDYKGLAIWWMDDGHLGKEDCYGTLSTCSFDEDSHIRIVKKLNDMGIECLYRSDGHGYLSVYINKNGIYELMKKIRQYLHPNMKYKFYNEYLEKSTFEYFEGTIETIYSNINNINPNILICDAIIKVNNSTFYIKYCKICCENYYHTKNFRCCACKNKYRYISIEPPQTCIDFYTWNNNLTELGTTKISSINKIKNPNHLNKVYDLEIENNHNFVLSSGMKNICGPIVHNCHHICSHTFSKALFKIGTKKMIGLSATPKRKDGLTMVLNWFMGDMIINKVASDISMPTVKFVYAEYSSNPKPTYNYKGMLNTAKMITELSQDHKRNRIILDELVILYEEGRNIILLSDRREHCIAFKLGLESKGITNVGLYLGGMSEKDLGKSNEAQIILATYSMAYEGYDNPKLDTLVMATGRGEVEQACGRILRTKNKFRPLVVDIVDIDYFWGQYDRRVKFYTKKKYELPKNTIIKKSKAEEVEEECVF